MYNIGYINANSLPDRKFSQAVSLLDTSFDFLFISEHWYQNHKSRLAHSSVLASTEYKTTPALQARRCRPCGGIYLLAKREVHHMILQISTTTHSITIQLPNFRFAAVYYPPTSISPTEIEHDLNSIGTVDILLGDINTRFNQFHSSNLPNSGQSNTSIRRKLFTNWAAHKNMLHLSDSSHPLSQSYLLIPDHVFAHTSKLSTLSLYHLPTKDIPFITDHQYLLHVRFNSSNLPHTFNNPIPHSTPLQTPPLRFHIQKLQNSETLKEFQNTWTKAFNIHSGYNHSEKFSIDMLDYLLAAQIQATAETVLGIYIPNSAKRKDDIVIGRLQERQDMNASIQLLKRASRAGAQSTPMTSSSSTLTAMEECTTHYASLFNRDENYSNTAECQTSINDSSIGKSTRDLEY